MEAHACLPKSTPQPNSLAAIGSAVEDGALCEFCATIDFHAVFAWKAELKVERPMHEVTQNRECILCRFIMACWPAAVTRVWKIDKCYIASYDHDHLPGFQASWEQTRGIQIRFYGLDKSHNRRLEEIDVTDQERYDRSPRSRKVPDVFDVGLLRGWLQQCDRHPQVHSGEFTLTTSNFPLRLVDVVEDKMVVPQELSSYVALSYAWGSQRSKPRSLSTFESIDRTVLPATIRDAMALTQAVGQRYIWIDCLCIDSSRPKDVSATIANMGTIYENAYVTVVAASGDDAEAGLARMRSPSDPRVTPLPMRFWSQGHCVCVMPQPVDLGDCLKHSHWGSRGWTYQEYKMSSRTVVFTDHEVFFQCAHGTRRREAYKPLQENACPHPSFALSKARFNDDGWKQHSRKYEDNYHAYLLAVEDYSSRTFTFPGDRLDAFLGVSRRLIPECSPTYRTALHGLPLVNFHQALAWSSKYPASSERITIDTRKTRPLPSWSWVGWSGAITQIIPMRDEAPLMIQDACNLVLAISTEHWGHALELSKIAIPSRCALHLWTRCTQIAVKKVEPAMPNNGCVYDYCLTFSANDDIRVYTVNSAGSEGFWSTCPDNRRTCWIASLEDVQHDRQDGCWLVLEGELLNAERIGILHLSADDQRLAFSYAQSRYLRII